MSESLYPDKRLYNEPDYIRGFSNGRYLDDDYTEIYTSFFAHHLSVGSTRVLDIGAGNGRFAIPLAVRLRGIQVDCLDLSQGMIAEIKLKQLNHSLSNIHVINKDFLAYKTEARYDLILFSESLHLFSDKHLWLQRAASMLSGNGRIIVRSPLRENLLSGDMYIHFPEALAIDSMRHCSFAEFQKIGEMLELAICKQETIKESVQLPRNDYLKIFEDKVYSTLRLIPHDIYRSRLSELASKVEGLEYVNHFINMSLIVLCHNSPKN
ncbi:class I SAM-dependent methyltransferase [Dyadobacter bucti]|uniref:class I SAM-dependent methyltransferase n=1 Tax=Dyadobacter bucti TaxID=2572203 RepID=UPI003F6F7981